MGGLTSHGKHQVDVKWQRDLGKRIASLIPKNIPLPEQFYPELLLNPRYWADLYCVNWTGPFVRYSPCLWSFMIPKQFSDNVYVWTNDKTCNGPLEIVRVTSENISSIDTKMEFEKVLTTCETHMRLPWNCFLSMDGPHYKISGDGAQFCMVWPSGKVDQLYLQTRSVGKMGTLVGRMYELLHWPGNISETDLHMEISSRSPVVLHYNSETGERICMLYNSNASGEDIVPFNWVATNFLSLTNNLEDRFCDLRKFLHLESKSKAEKRNEIDEISATYYTRILYYPTGPVILFKCVGPPDMLEISDESVIPLSITEYFDFKAHMDSITTESSVFVLLEYIKQQYKTSHSLSASPQPNELAGLARYMFELATCWVYDLSDKYKELRNVLCGCGENSPFRKGKYAAHGPYHPFNSCAAVKSVISGAMAHICKDFLFFPIIWSDETSIEQFMLLNAASLFNSATNSRLECSATTWTPKFCENHTIETFPPPPTEAVAAMLPSGSYENQPALIRGNQTNADKSEPTSPGQQAGDFVPKTPTSLGDVPTMVNSHHLPTPSEDSSEQYQPLTGDDVRPSTPKYRSPPPISPGPDDLNQTKIATSPVKSRHASQYETHIRAMCSEIKKRPLPNDALFWAKTNQVPLKRIYHCMTVTRPSQGITKLCAAERVVHDFVVRHSDELSIVINNKQTQQKLESAITKKKRASAHTR